MLAESGPDPVRGVKYRESKLVATDVMNTQEILKVLPKWLVASAGVIFIVVFLERIYVSKAPIYIFGKLVGPAQIIRGDVPVGVIVPYAGPVETEGQRALERAGWLLCDDSSKKKSDYKALADAIAPFWDKPGEGHKEAEENDRFNLPDLRGRFLRGLDLGTGRDKDAAGRTNGFGTVVGSIVGSLQNDEVGPHTHLSPLLYHGDQRDEFKVGSQGMAQWPARTGVTPRVFNAFNDGKESRPINAAINWIIRFR